MSSRPWRRELASWKCFAAATPRTRRVHVRPWLELFTPAKTDCPVPVQQLQACRTTQHNQDSLPHVDDPSCAHAKPWDQPWTGQTVFQVCEPPGPEPCEQPPAGALCQWSKRQLRQVRSGVYKAMKVQEQAKHQNSEQTYDVIEFFSPLRFQLECEGLGFPCASPQMKRLVSTQKPKLLVLCPPCTWAGGWYHLNRLYLDPSERRRGGERGRERPAYASLPELYCKAG